MKRYLSWAALGLVLSATPGLAQEVRVPPPDPFGTLTLTSENDLFGGGSDRYYSNGALLTWRSPSAELPGPFAWLDRRLAWLFGDGTLRWGVSLGGGVWPGSLRQRPSSSPIPPTMAECAAERH